MIGKDGARAPFRAADRERLKSLSSPGVSNAFRSRFWCTCTRSKSLSPLEIIAGPKHMGELCVDSGMFLGIGIICAVTRCCPADRKKGRGSQFRHFDRGSIKLKGEVDYDRLARIISCILSSPSAKHRDPMQVSRNSWRDLASHDRNPDPQKTSSRRVITSLRLQVRNYEL